MMAGLPLMVNNILPELYVWATNLGADPAQNHSQSTIYHLKVCLNQYPSTLSLCAFSKGP
jgi:hypothetical protein